MKEDGSKLNVTSSAIEKGLDIAKDFLDKLIFPAVEETGLLIKEKATYWKFKNQVRVLMKAREYCEGKGINPKAVSMKILCPLLDHAALEEDEHLQDKWAFLLGNLTDSEQNVENHVFPYLLSQISRKEFKLLESLDIFNIPLVTKLETEYNLLKENLKQLKASNHRNYRLYMETTGEIRENVANKNRLKVLVEENIENFEIENLVRLGLVVIEPFLFGATEQLNSEVDTKYGEVVIPPLDVEIYSQDRDISITELGIKFINACMEKYDH